MSVIIIEMATHSQHFALTFRPFSTPSVISYISCLYHSFLKSYYHDIKSTLHIALDALIFMDFTLDNIDNPFRKYDNFVQFEYLIN